jgi:hypothetical protein
VLDRIGGSRSAFLPAWIRSEKALVQHEHVVIIYTWIPESIERLENSSICGLALDEADIALRGAKRKKTFNCWTGVSEGIFRTSLRYCDRTAQARRVQMAIDHFAPQVLKKLGLGSH